MRTTESNSHYRHLEQRSIEQLTHYMSAEDHSVPGRVRACLPQIQALISHLEVAMASGGRLFYLGAGTSGRLGILDASECPPTFGVDHGRVIGLIAGGDSAIRKAVEHAEDDPTLAWDDLSAHDINKEDTVVGIAASGTTPYVIGGLDRCQQEGITTGCITCNEGSPLAEVSNYPIECVVGPELVTGSTRMKAGTAQKMILNMITTVTMIRLGHVLDNKMVDMQLSNDKLIERGTRMIMERTLLNHQEAKSMLIAKGSVRAVLADFNCHPSH